MGGANSCWHCSTLRPFASNSDLWSLFLGRSRCVVSSCVDTVEGRVEGRGLELCLKLCVPSISGPAALPCTPGPSLTAYTHTHTHTHTHRCTQILVVRSLGTDVCLCTCVHEHVCCECMGGEWDDWWVFLWRRVKEALWTLQWKLDRTVNMIFMSFKQKFWIKCSESYPYLQFCPVLIFPKSSQQPSSTKHFSSKCTMLELFRCSSWSGCYNLSLSVTWSSVKSNSVARINANWVHFCNSCMCWNVTFL